MNQAAPMPHASPSTLFAHEPSLDASDEFEDVCESARPCPRTLLGKFSAAMAGHGRSVDPDSMLADREYAVWQLAKAHGMADENLRALAVKLFALCNPSHGWSGAQGL